MHARISLLSLSFIKKDGSIEQTGVQSKLEEEELLCPALGVQMVLSLGRAVWQVLKD